MKSFLVYFANDRHWAERDIEAVSAEDALRQARRIATDRLCRFDYKPYDGLRPVSEIEVLDERANVLAVWHDDERRLRLAAPDLLEAAEKVVARWERGDLAAAIRELDAAIAEAKGGAG